MTHMDRIFWGGMDGWTVLAIIGLVAISVLSRSFFFLSQSQWQLPHWAQRGLLYAPIAALSAVIAPEMVMTQGHLTTTLADARIYAVGAGIAFFFWRKGSGQAVLGTIVVGMAVYLPLHIGLGW
jgi:branched-subunit amino acid transport protein